jgi:membrane-associated phospholipid phosphatase
MKKIIASFSYTFHPLLISLYACLFYLFGNDHTGFNAQKTNLILMVLLITIVLPILIFIVLKRVGIIQSMMSPSIDERKIPIVIQCFTLLFIVQKIVVIDQHFELHFFFLAVLFSSILALVFLFFKIKASIHMAGICGLYVFALGLRIHFAHAYFAHLMLLLLLIVLVAMSRIQLKAHTLKEVIIGSGVGLLPQLALLPIWL